MEIQQHDGVVVDVAGLRQGFAKLLREREAAAKGGKGVPCPPRQGGSSPLGFPTLGAWVEAQGGAPQPTKGWFPSTFSPRGPPG